ncbi:hypothetical protein CVD28_01195 [Bacillus sp. M6-12]|uniref:hypothetical protein n=1 Tax=Bacillus sp. M6-12 TaxID=2054166 RepID=UPI000C763AC4|nr:hypothetical protein [Bacillus sp. M6-12]PLS19049.1 hypothetical protein CVD28_01195 [Bacillus sp. M6-12]
MLKPGSLMKIQKGIFYILPYENIEVDWEKVSKEFQSQFIFAYEEGKILLETKGQEKEGLNRFVLLDRIAEMINQKKITIQHSFSDIVDDILEPTMVELEIA